MKIDIDRSAITAEGSEFVTGDSSIQSGERIAGLRTENEIYLPPNSVLTTITNYCHEVGHIIGDEMSFQQGLTDGEDSVVLSIDEVKNPRCIIMLSLEERRLLRTSLLKPVTKETFKLAMAIGNKLLSVFSKDTFQPNTISCSLVTQTELEELVELLDINTLTRNEDGSIIAINSKQGRNHELPAMNTELCCSQILENTLKEYFILPEHGHLEVNTSESPAHQRATNIVARAFLGECYRLPSMKDIRDKAA